MILKISFKYWKIKNRTEDNQWVVAFALTAAPAATPLALAAWISFCFWAKICFTYSICFCNSASLLSLGFITIGVALIEPIGFDG